MLLLVVMNRRVALLGLWEKNHWRESERCERRHQGGLFRLRMTLRLKKRRMVLIVSHLEVGTSGVCCCDDDVDG